MLEEGQVSCIARLGMPALKAGADLVATQAIPGLACSGLGLGFPLNLIAAKVGMVLCAL